MFQLVVLAQLNLLVVIIKKMIVVLMAMADAKVASKLQKVNVAGWRLHEVRLIALLTLKDLGGGEGPKVPSDQEIVCHFSQGHAMVTSETS